MTTHLQKIISDGAVLSREEIEVHKSLVLEVQDRLTALGLYTGKVDGLYGRQTDWANTRFCNQNWLNCPATNRYGVTWARKLIDTSQVPKGFVITEAQAEHIFKNPIYANELADLNACMTRFQITKAVRIRHFMSQIAHESGGLRWLMEIASGDAYEFRSDLGNTKPGDGRRYKGAGAIQLTGRANYQAFADYMEDPNVMQGCSYVAKTYPFTSAGFFWHRNSMNDLCDRGATVEQVTLRVNGGYNGLADRKYYYDLACQVI